MLHDYKLSDPAAHKRWTGADNALILENFRKAYAQFPAQVIARIPLIPGVNDDEAHIDAVLDASHRTECRRARAIAYHRYGDSKYGFLAACMRSRTSRRRRLSASSSCAGELHSASSSDGLGTGICRSPRRRDQGEDREGSKVGRARAGDRRLDGNWGGARAPLCPRRARPGAGCRSAAKLKALAAELAKAHA